jgi:serine/threonine-protein kinase
MSGIGEAQRYREIARLGAGGMATVTLAQDTLLGRPVALKRVYASGDRRGALRLKREALVGASLNHPNLVSIYDAQVQQDGDVVIVMEYVDGSPLSDVLRTQGALAPPEALRVLGGLAAALDAIHARGIVHRDVKPPNVLVGTEGAVKLADLGIADVADRTRITTSGAIVGSFSYMAPEQLHGASPSPKMDIYALAAVAYETLCGTKARPEGNPLALAHAIATQPPPDLRKIRPEAPAGAAAVLAQGMSSDPGQRPKTAGELVKTLERAYEPARPAVPSVPARRRRRAGASIGAASAPAVGRSLRAGSPHARQPRPVSRDAPSRARRPLGQGAGPQGTPQPRRTAGVSPAGRSDEPSKPGRRRRVSALVSALVVLAILAIAGLVVAALTPGDHSPSRASRSQAARAKPTGTAASSSRARSHATTSSAAANAPATGRARSTSPGVAAGPAERSTLSPLTPAGAVQTFYSAAADHRYAAAWALADSNLRQQVGGYAAFASQMSSVRSIEFHQAKLVSAGADSATVALQTTSVQTRRTQRCAGTARTVRSGQDWLLDHISINCSA